MGNRLQGKRILIVDDEPDVLASLEGLLSGCEVAKSSSFEEAKKCLESQSFDIVVLDIMGVNGYELLEIANRAENIIAVMLTGHALSPENIVKSFKGGAASYLPKEEMANISVFLEEILELKETGKNIWVRWLNRWGAFCDKRFGVDWQKKDEEFWRKFKGWV